MPKQLPNSENVDEILLPDGSEVSEVLDPDGNVVWTASALPDSVIHHWELSEGGGNQIADNVGSQDGTIHGASWVSNSWAGGYALSGDGNSDYVSIDNFPLSFRNTLDFSVSLTLQTEDSGGEHLFGVSETVDGENETFNLYVDGSALQFTLQGQGEPGILNCTGGTPNDGNPHRVDIVVDGDDVNDWKYYLDGSEADSSVLWQDMTDPVFKDVTEPLALLADNEQGDIQDHADAIIDNIMIAQPALTPSQISDIYDSQPWS